MTAILIYCFGIIYCTATENSIASLPEKKKNYRAGEQISICQGICIMGGSDYQKAVQGRFWCDGAAAYPNCGVNYRNLHICVKIQVTIYQITFIV